MQLLDKSGLEEHQICYAGDDWIDLPVLQRCGLAITVPSADREVKDRVHWVTTRAGGEGAVREMCDLILTAQGHHQRLLQEILAQ
jgi:3-deoxy-D-manno-octulosonate 8-phosphate phosphatase (KDO 8-P phosphatase)